MTRARRWGAALTGVAACLALGDVSVAAASSAGTPEGAYWWQPEPVTGLIPVPGVPSNGLYVASAPNGPQAESAVRFTVANPSGVVRLTLHVSKQEQVRKPGVLGYPATSHWTTGGPQPWSARPSYRARAKPARGQFDAALTTMTITFPAAEAAKGIVLVPGGSPTAGQSPTFSVSFAAPTAADITVDAPPSPTAAPSTQHPPTPSHHPNPGGGATSSRPGRTTHPPTRQTRPTHGTVPPPGTTSPSHSPSASAPAASPTHTEASSLADPDGATKDVIIAGGAIVAALLILIGWRAVRRG